MLARFNIFRKKVDPEVYFSIGGPKSFRKYECSNLDLILIGENHHAVPPAHARQYVAVFNRFLEENRQAGITVESSDEEKNPEANSGHGFIDCLLDLDPRHSKRIMPFDPRNFKNSWVKFQGFLSGLCRTFAGLRDYANKRKVKVTPEMFFKNQELVQALYDDAKDIEPAFTIKDLCEFFCAEVTRIDRVANEYLEKNQHLRDFLGESVLGVNDGLGITLELEKCYLAMGFTEEYAQTRSLANVVIDMMVRKQDLQVLDDWHSALSCYYSHFLDAAYACMLWEAIQETRNEKHTLIFACGDAHARRLGGLLEKLCVTVRAIPQDESGAAILPETLNEYLHGQYEHAPSENKCVLI